MPPEPAYCFLESGRTILDHHDLPAGNWIVILYRRRFLLFNSTVIDGWLKHSVKGEIRFRHAWAPRFQMEKVNYLTLVNDAFRIDAIEHASCREPPVIVSGFSRIVRDPAE
jgi:hypothetical protein